MKYLIIGLVAACLIGCNPPVSDKAGSGSFSQVDDVIQKQFERPPAMLMQKTVSLGEETDQTSMTPDSATWVREIAFLKELNPNQRGYVGAFTKEENERSVRLTLAPNEKGSLKELHIEKEGNDITALYGVIFEDKGIYSHQRKIEVAFIDGMITGYKVMGFQKIIMKDTIFFSIEVKAAL